MKAPFSKLRRNRKGGVSVVIATIMAIFVLMMAVSQIYLYQNTLTGQTQATLAEKFTLTNLFVDNTTKTTNFTLTNTGTVQVQFIAIWVNYSRTLFKQVLNPTESENYGLPNSNLGTDISYTFDVQIETQRGNRIIESYSPEPAKAPEEVQATGIFKMDWFYAKYSSKNTAKTSFTQINYHEHGSQPSSAETYVAFYLKITNNWIYPATIKNQSFLTLVILQEDPEFYVANGVTTSKTSLTAFTEKVVEPHTEIELVFGASSAGSSAFKWDGSGFPQVNGSSMTTEGASIQVSLLYSCNGMSLGQVLTAQAFTLNRVTS